MQRSFTFVLLLVVLFALLAPAAAQDAPTPEPVGLRPDAPTYAVHGPYWVGTQELIIDEESEHPIPLTVWYPALNPDNAPETVIYRAAEGSPAEMYLPPGWTEGVTVTGNALRDAPPDASGGPYPLVIFSHGFTAPKANVYIGEHLASQGFIVLAPEHMQDAWESVYPSYAIRLPEIQRAIAYSDSLTATGGLFEGLIDTEKIAVGGHSAGGMVTYGAGGAPLNWATIEQYCTETPEDAACVDLAAQREPMASELGLDAPAEGMWPAFWDPRVDAIFPIAGTMEMYGQAGLADLSVPMLTLYGSLDEYGPWLSPAYELAGSSRKGEVVFENAGHEVFINRCDTTPWLVAAELTFLCTDEVWDMDRAHDLTNHFITAFLLSTLKGDAEATAALAPDVVAFPGITYQAEGF
jgi:predicted dienelactone hydrolase